VVDLDPLQSASPAEVFRDMLDRTVADLQHATYVEEWLGRKQRLPVFDVQVLRDYGADPANRDRLAALLASYVRVTSGSFWERSGNRWRRRRFSELNLLDLAEVGALGRLGDLALFLSGVFPEYVSSHPLDGRELSRLARLMERNPGELARSQEPFWLMEWVGKSAYGRAGEAALAGHFRSARRLLNVLTGRHLFPIREVWFPGATGS
jgi:hypothetical protein